MVSNKNMFKY